MRVALLTLLVTAAALPAAEPPAPRLDRHGDPLPPGAALRLGTVRLRQGFLVSSAMFSPDGKELFLAAAGQNTVGVFDSESGRRLRQIGQSGWSATTMAMDPAGGRFAVSNDAQGCPVMAADTGVLLRRLGNTWSRAVAWSADGKRVAVAHAEGMVVYNPDNGQPVFKGETDVADVGFSANGLLVAVTALGRVVTYNAAGTPGPAFDARDGEPSALAVPPNGSRVAVQRANELVTVYDLATGTAVVKLPVKSSSHRALRFSPDGKRLAAGGADGKVTLFDTETWKPAVLIPAADFVAMPVEFSPDGKRLVTSGVWHSGVRIWDTATGKELTPPAVGHLGSVWELRVSADGKTLHSWGREKAVLRWNLETAEGVARTPVAADGLFHANATISPDGSLLCSTQYKDRAVKLYDLRSGKELHTLHTDSAPPKGRFNAYPTAFSPDGGRVAVGDPNGLVRVFEVATGKEVAKFTENKLGRPVTCLRFRPNGTELVVTLDRGATVFAGVARWDIAANKVSKWLNVARTICFADYSPDGTRVVVCSEWQGPPVVLDAATGKVLHTLAAHTKGSSSAAFSADGLFLAVGGADADELVRVWDPVSGQELATFTHPCCPTMMAFTHEGRRLVSGGCDATLLVWDLTGKSGGLGDVPPTLAEAYRRLGAAGGPGVLPAVAAFSTDPDVGLTFLKTHLKPAVAPDAAEFAKLVARLDAPAFADREAASTGIAKFGTGAISELRKAVATATSQEVKDRLQRLLDRFETGPDATTARRAVGILAGMKSPGGTEWLRTLSKGAADAPVTREAAAALR